MRKISPRTMRPPYLRSSILLEQQLDFWRRKSLHITRKSRYGKWQRVCEMFRSWFLSPSPSLTNTNLLFLLRTRPSNGTKFSTSTPFSTLLRPFSLYFLAAAKFRDGMIWKRPGWRTWKLSKLEMKWSKSRLNGLISSIRK